MINAKPRAHMPPSKRAKIFAPFDALSGLKEAIAETERITEPRRDLSDYSIEVLNRRLSKLEEDQIITVIYYCENQQKYQQITGAVRKVDVHKGIIQLDSECISFSDLYDILL